MNGTSDVINAIEKILQTDIMHIVISFVLTATALLILRVIAEAAAGFIQLRLDQHLAIGSLVEIYEHKGRIKRVSLFTITIETEDYFIRVPTKKWRESKILILKDIVTLNNRRKEDIEKLIKIHNNVNECMARRNDDDPNKCLVKNEEKNG